MWIYKNGRPTPYYSLEFLEALAFVELNLGGSENINIDNPKLSNSEKPVS